MDKDSWKKRYVKNSHCRSATKKHLREGFGLGVGGSEGARNVGRNARLPKNLALKRRDEWHSDTSRTTQGPKPSHCKTQVGFAERGKDKAQDRGTTDRRRQATGGTGTSSEGRWNYWEEARSSKAAFRLKGFPPCFPTGVRAETGGGKDKEGPTAMHPKITKTVQAGSSVGPTRGYLGEKNLRKLSGGTKSTLFDVEKGRGSPGGKNHQTTVYPSSRKSGIRPLV